MLGVIILLPIKKRIETGKIGRRNRRERRIGDKS